MTIRHNHPAAIASRAADIAADQISTAMRPTFRAIDSLLIQHLAQHSTGAWSRIADLRSDLRNIEAQLMDCAAKLGGGFEE